MKQKRIPRISAAEAAYVRDMRRRSAFDLVDDGKAEILSKREYPKPVRRFLARERRILRIRVSAAAKRRLEQLSRNNGLSPEELARRWIEKGLARAAG